MIRDLICASAWRPPVPFCWPMHGCSAGPGEPAGPDCEGGPGPGPACGGPCEDCEDRFWAGTGEDGLILDRLREAVDGRDWAAVLECSVKLYYFPYIPAGTDCWLCANGREEDPIPWHPRIKLCPRCDFQIWYQRLQKKAPGP